MVYACAATCTARVTESKSSPKPRVAEQGWPGASLAALSTKVPPFFARPLAEHFLRRKAPDICAPQAKKISVAGQPTHFCDEIMPLHARTCSWWSSQRLQLKQRSSSLQPAEHRLHHTLARSARSVPAWMSPLNLQPWESTPESTPGWDGTGSPTGGRILPTRVGTNKRCANALVSSHQRRGPPQSLRRAFCAQNAARCEFTHLRSSSPQSLGAYPYEAALREMWSKKKLVNSVASC